MRLQDPVCADGPRVRWRVQVKAGSNLVGISPEPGFPMATVALIATPWLRGLGTWNRVRQSHRISRREQFAICMILRRSSEPMKPTTPRLRFGYGNNQASLTHRSVVHTGELLSAAYADHGSIDGRLQIVSERRGLHVVVYDPLWDKPVRCHLSDEQAQIALNNFGKRVEVFGLVRYRGDGTPVSIDVEEIVPFPVPEHIPGYRAVYGILRDAP